MREGYTVKQKMGALLHDFPLYAWALRPRVLCGKGVHPWVHVRNRKERLVIAGDGPGVSCDWRWTSTLHGAAVFPRLGKMLMGRALSDYPIVLEELDAVPAGTEAPAVTFVIGHRGRGRLPQLKTTLRSIAAQRGVSVECIVVEQDVAQKIGGHLPEWVRYVHCRPAVEGMAYSRSWAFNVGVRLALGRLVVLHDNDILMPGTYAAELAKMHREGFEVINLKRFIFFLTQEHTDHVISSNRLTPLDFSPKTIVQNAEGGGSIAVDRETYISLGGFDEEFVGWGGEDSEFWERALTRRVYPFGHLPFVHLWHTPQPGKRAVLGRGAATAEVFARREAIPPSERIRELSSRPFGNPKRINEANKAERH